MILYHMTGLWPLVGTAGLEALKADPTRKAGDVATPDSILRAGLKARARGDYALALRSPMAPCVWFTSDPKMPSCFSSNSGFRITVEIAETDDRLIAWPAYVRAHATAKGRSVLAARMTRFNRGRDFWAYFADVPLEHFRAIKNGP